MDKLKLSKKEFIYDGGKKFYKKKLRSSGGRVLNITAVGNKC